MKAFQHLKAKALVSRGIKTWAGKKLITLGNGRGKHGPGEPYCFPKVVED